MNALRLSGAAMAVTVLLAAAAALGLDACHATDAYICSIPTPGEVGADGSPDPCHCNVPDGTSCFCTTPGNGALFFQQCMTTLAGLADAGDASEGGPLPGCNGQCLPNPPSGWSAPLLLWFGHEIDAPACPENAPTVGYEGHADPTTMPVPCGACSCKPPAGTCELPASITASTAPCADAGSPVPFNGPAGWDGGCTAYDAIDAGVGSLTIAPLVLDESGCTPAQGTIQTDMPGTWSTFVRACSRNAGAPCPSLAEACSPAASNGFRQCVFFLAGDMDCPSPSVSPYTEKHVFFASADDTRQCSPCVCASAPGTCSAMLSVYGDSACTVPVDSTVVTAAIPLCLGVPSLALGSKSIGPATYAPGACQPSGGEPMGSVVPVMPSTFCCLPP